MDYKTILSEDNNSEFYYMNDDILKYCPKCGLIINRKEATQESIGSFKIKRKKHSLSSTWDGVRIVSQNFVDVYNKYHLSGLSFVDLPKSKGFFMLLCNNLVHYDYAFNKTLVLKDKCPVCGQYQDVSCINPAKIIDEDIATLQKNTFYVSDLISGNRVRRNPILYATEDIPSIFKKELKDIYFF